MPALAAQAMPCSATRAPCGLRARAWQPRPAARPVAARPAATRAQQPATLQRPSSAGAGQRLQQQEQQQQEQQQSSTLQRWQPVRGRLVPAERSAARHVQHMHRAHPHMLHSLRRGFAANHRRTACDASSPRLLPSPPPTQGSAPAAAPAPASRASLAAAAALGLGGLLAAGVGPAAASELFDVQQAGAFIPGLVGDDPLRCVLLTAVWGAAGGAATWPGACEGLEQALPSPIAAPLLARPCREGFVQALLLIFFSEIGDKTFFIALLLALQQPRALVFAGTFGALAVMTVVSVGLGRVLHVLDEVRGYCEQVFGWV